MEDESQVTDEESVEHIDFNKIIKVFYDSYSKLDEKLKEELRFKDYLFARLKVLELDTPLDNNDSVADFNYKDTKEDIPEEELCKMCKEERETPYSPGLCFKCNRIKSEEADKKSQTIIDELVKDDKFLSCKNIRQRKVYVENKYSKEIEENRHISPGNISQDAYAKYHLLKEGKISEEEK